MSTAAVPATPGHPARPARLPARRSGVPTAGMVVGVLDGLFAIAFSAAVTGAVAPARVFQGIARGVLGPAALDGGAPAAALGVALHFAIAYAWTAAYDAALRRSGALRRAVATTAGAVAVGLAYGALVWLVMRLAVIPLSRVGPGPIVPRTFLVMLVGHVLVVGLPIALIVRPRATPPATPPAA